MEEFLSMRLEDLLGRLHGPMNVRIYIQPAIAAILAILAGLRDAREGKPAFFWALFSSNPHDRRGLLREAWKDIAKVFAVAIALDVVYQFMVLRMFYPIEAMVVAILLAVVPYLLLRAAVGRLFGRKKSAP